MTLARPSPGLRLFASVSVLAGALGGCSTARPDPAEALRSRFPVQAAEILGTARAFAAEGEGFVPSVDAVDVGLRATLPRRGEGVIRLGTASGFEARVREIGASGEGALAGGAVAYPRAGGASYWSATDEGLEEWLLLDEGTAFADRAVAAWQIEGATPSQHGDLVELRDEADLARLRVTAPRAHAASGRPVTVRLAVQGDRIELHVDGRGERVLVDPAWAPTMSMSTPRANHTATLLETGKVFIAGGGTTIDTTELYDPPSGTWSSAHAMSMPRARHTATVLGDGDVLIVGGSAANSADLYTPGTNLSVVASAPGSPRSGHTATRLADGRVLVAGDVALAELYDPASGMWSAAGTLSAAVRRHTATLLPDGRVLVAGGTLGVAQGETSAWLFDPSAKAFAPIDPMTAGRAAHTATLLPNGRVLVAGGFDQTGTALASAAIYDPVAGHWAPTASMSVARAAHTATLLTTGSVLVAGGATTAATELFDPVHETWASAGSLATGRDSHTATLTGYGSVLVAGGEQATTLLSTAELFGALALGTPCVQPGECASGFCSDDGVCCDSACDAGPCDACTVAAGASVNGTCAKLTDHACDDGDACTQVDTCQAGVCKGTSPKPCAAPDACHDGVCDPATGTCNTPPKSDGTVCDDHDLCTLGEACQGGVCTSSTQVACPTLDACHAPGVCDPGTGKCFNAVLPGCASGSAGAQLCQTTADCSGGASCAHGVCCDTPCTDPCHSCALPGHVGVCTLEPPGVDLNQDCAPVATCLSTCGPAGACIGAGVGTQCEASHCTDATHGEGAAVCASKGAPCPLASRAPFDCGLYRCEPAFGACNERCQSVAECAAGSVCDPDGKCVAPPDQAAGHDASCAVGRPSSGGGSAAALLAGLVVAMGVGRRRARGRRRAFGWGAIPLAALLIGCGTHPSSDASRLDQQFPGQAASILGGARAFADSADGFAVPEDPGTGVRMTLPRHGDGAIRVATAGGFEARVREVGASGEGARRGSAVTYAVAGGTSYWTATREGYEEWLLLDEGLAFAERTAAAWEIEGATLSQHGALIELRDEAGRARFRVTAPRAYAAGGRAVAVTLEARGERIELHVDGRGERVLVDPAWSGTASMLAVRKDHTATLLGNSKVLVAGGDSGGGTALASAELFDPQTKTWTLTGSMAEARISHVATLLGDGTVLVAGGLGAQFELSSAEVYDAASGGWSPTGAMTTERVYHAAMVLGDGKVLVAGGGLGGNPLTSADLYDPVLQTWTPTGDMNVGRSLYTLTLLGNGRVLAAAGFNSMGVDGSAEVFDPGSGAWSIVPAMSAPRDGHTATLLPNGRVLVAGGTNADGDLASAEIFDPLAPGWTATGAMGVTRVDHTATLLGNGQVLAAGGAGAVTSTELFDPVSGTWKPTGSMSAGRSEHTAIRLGTGAVLVAGGTDDNVSLSSAELFAPLPLGAPCTQVGECASSFCADGVCCDAACDAGACDACSVAAGAAVAGTCARFTDTACDDGNPCTQADTCQSGVCKGGSPKVCAEPDVCHFGVCDPASGACTTPPKPNGTACEDGDLCTKGDTCMGGTCTALTTTVCTALDACHLAGTCIPATGLCSNPLSDGCAPTTDGGASQKPVTPSGFTACDTAADCPSAGPCSRGVCCDTPCTDPCHSCAVPDHVGVCTEEPIGVDLNHDCAPIPSCLGTCGPGGACIGAGKGTQCAPVRCIDDSHGVGAAYCPSEGAECDLDGDVFDCGAYRCEPALGACYERCESIAECAPGWVCDPSGRCATPPDVANGQDVGCDVAPAGRTSPWWAALLALTATTAAHRRSARRRSLLPRSPRSPRGPGRA